VSKILVEVNKNPNENNPSLLRRFSRLVQDGGFFRRVKGTFYAERKVSAFKTKKKALRRIEKQKELEQKRKAGKLR